MKSTCINKEFLKKTSLNPIWIDETPFFSKEELPSLIEAANDKGFVFLGADGFYINEGQIMPDLDWIIESSFTSVLKKKELTIFLKGIVGFLNNAPDDIFFECIFSCD